MAGLEAFADDDGVRLRWSTPARSFDAFDVLRRSSATGGSYARLPGIARSEANGTRWEYLDPGTSPDVAYAYEVRGHRADGSVESFGPVLVTTAGTVARFTLHPMRPNPAAGATVVRFELARQEPVAVEVFDVAGHRVRQLFQGRARAGLNVVGWDGLDATGRPAPRGVYFVRYRWPRGYATQRLTLLR